MLVAVERSTTLEIVRKDCANFTRSFCAPLHGVRGGETNVSEKNGIFPVEIYAELLVYLTSNLLSTERQPYPPVRVCD